MNAVPEVCIKPSAGTKECQGNLVRDQRWPLGRERVEWQHLTRCCPGYRPQQAGGHLPW